MTKDRLGEFKKKRQHGSFRCSFRRPAKPSDLDEDDEDVIQVQETVKEIQNDIDEMQKSVGQLKMHYRDVVTSPFAAPTAMEKVEKLNDEIRLQAGVVSKKLRRLDQKKAAGNNGSNTEQEEDERSLCVKTSNSALSRLSKTQFVLLSTRLSSVMEELNAAEVAFRGDSKRRLQRQMSIAGSRIPDAELEQKVDDNLQGKFPVFTQDIVTDIDSAKKRKEEMQACLKQNQCILSLEYNIREMHTIFQDVALLIGRQGEVVDSIQHHVQRTASFVESGKNDLAQARLMKKSNVKLKVLIIFAVLLAAIIFIIIILLIHYLS